MANTTTNNKWQQQIRLETKLKREYRHLNDELERLFKNNPININDVDDEHPYGHISLQVDQIVKRQEQIIKERETCTGIEIPVKTEKEILEENKRIQNEGWIPPEERKK